ncbi:replication fork protection complex subunit Tof1/Swi1 [Rhodotorula toruloides]|uniref:Replication fork protection complex subunit Tof1/Swi1 n=1 Tax=Rhodotorula toruloides TaxID=5286 RepID=A0A511K9S4_RHOTO|nr:replication fork protection complex subunit Tof1/Swi1 [Rhodotorula toruloides]
MPKHKGYASDDSEPETYSPYSDDDAASAGRGAGPDEDLESGWSDGGAPMTAQQRKRAALHPPISSICAALGGFEEFLDENGQVYIAYSLGDQVVGCLKDLKRFWRMDEKDDDRTVARIFHEIGVLKTDLIPILKTTLGTGAKGDRIALACVELIGAMTWPINVAEELRDAQLLGELKQSRDFTTLIDAQRGYKASIIKEGVLRHMMSILAGSLQKGRRDRTQKDENIISLILHVFRNLAYLTDRATPASSASASAIEQSSLQSDLIASFSREGILDLLLAMSAHANSSDYAPWNMVVLDILHLLYRGVRADELMVPEKEVENVRLKELLDLEQKQGGREFALKGSRHSRFGTTIAVQSNGRKYILHKQSTLSEGPSATLDKIKRAKAKKVRIDDDLAPPATQLRPEAVRILYETSKKFVESAFNPFFASVLRDIRMERLKVRESDTLRFLYLSSFFLEFFLLLYRDDERRGISHLDEESGHDFGLVAELTEPHAIGFVTMRMKNALEEKPPLWTDLHAGVECFTQILLVIEALQASGIPEHIDVAEILQNKLYYEAETLEMVVTLITRYSTQSYKYLDAVIHLAYTLLRMLEKYSKSKAYMYVRKKKAGRAAAKKKRQKNKNTDENDGDGLGMGEAEEDEEQEEVEQSAVSFGEHAFQFEKFEQRFADDSVLSTCMIYLESYKTFRTPEQMKRIVALMHRQAIKAKSEGLFYKPTVLELFRRILEDRDIAEAREGPNADLRKLIEYVLRKFFKAVQEHPFLLLECFFPKTRTQLGKMRMGEVDPFADSDDDTLMYKAKKIGEVEVQPGFSHTQQIGIAVACLLDGGEQRLLDMVKKQLVLASATRTEIILTTDGPPNEDVAMLGDVNETDAALREKAAQLKGPSAEAVALFTPHVVEYGEDSQVKEAATVNPHVKLLMRLLSWESSEAPESRELVWAIPASILPSKLHSDLKIIEDFVLDPVDPQNGKSATELLRKQRKKPVRRKRKILSEAEMELGSDGEPIIKVKRKRQKKRQEEEQAYKSAQFINDSDDEDDPDRDAAFFAAEAALRAKLAAGQVSVHLESGSKKKKQPKGSTAAATSVRATSPASSPPPNVPKKGKAGGRKKTAKKTKFDAEMISDLEYDAELVNELRQEVSRHRGRADELEEPAGPSLPASSSTGASGKRAPSASSATSSPPATARATVFAGDEDDEEAVGTTQAKKKRRVILDSDDE